VPSVGAGQLGSAVGMDVGGTVGAWVGGSVGATVAVGNASVGAGISRVTMGVGLGAQAASASIAAIIRGKKAFFISGITDHILLYRFHRGYCHLDR